MIRKQVVFIALCIFTSMAISRGQNSATNRDPRIGTWKLNLDKSQYTTGGLPAPKMQMRRLEVWNDGFTVFTQSGLDEQNNPVFIQVTYKLDAKKYPEYTQTTLPQFSTSGTTPNMNTYRLSGTDTVEITRFDSAGQVTGTSVQVMSQDGRTHTAIAKDASGGGIEQGYET